MMLSALWSYALHPTQWSVAIVAALIAAAIDVRTHRIPNLLTGPLLLAGLVWACCVGQWTGLADSVCGVTIVGGPFFALWMLRGGGAGDAKMMMALGAWLGVWNGAAVLMCVALAGGLVSIGYAIAQRRLAAALLNVGAVLWATTMLVLAGQRSVRNRELIPSIHSPQAFPYGLAIFLGTAVAGLGTLWMRA